MSDLTPGVLAVAEEAFFRQAMSDTLKAAGIACTTAGSGEQALREAENPAVGVVVLDLQLSDVPGLELLERLRALRHEVRVIVLSSAADQDLILRALRNHACDYLAKPLHEEELVLTVGRALRSYRVEASRAALRRRLGRLEAQLAYLSEIPPADESTSPIERVAQRSVEAVATVLGATKTSLMLLDDGGEQLRVAAATGRSLPPGEMNAVKWGQEVAGLALSDGAAMVAQLPVGAPQVAQVLAFASAVARLSVRPCSVSMSSVTGFLPPLRYRNMPPAEASCGYRQPSGKGPRLLDGS
ncbi:MAG: response regulator, partial [Gemmatimonadetes bacterium]|nr:response regulator [Gemmatimonadota bacterium]